MQPTILKTDGKAFPISIIKDKAMNLPNDPFMLLSVINMKLRDNYSSLDELCEDMDVSREEIEEKLTSAGFEYDENSRSFG